MIRINNYFKIILLVCIIYFSPFLKAFSIEELKLDLVYPKQDTTIYSNKTFFIGSTTPGAKLTINGISAKVFPSGSFVKIIPLTKGANHINITSVLNGEKKTISLDVNTPKPIKSLPHKPLKIVEDSIYPKTDIYYKPGDTITVKFRGSTGYNANFQIGKIKVPMKELPVSIAGVKGYYKGQYTIKEKDNFKSEQLKVRLKSTYTRLTKEATSHISVIPKDKIILGEIISTKAPLRTFPYGGRLTPLPKRTRVVINGKYKNHYRIRLSSCKQAWIKEDDIKILLDENEIPDSEIKTIKVIDKKSALYLKIPMSERLPVSIREKNNMLILDIYGAKANISTLATNKSDFIEKLSWRQPQSEVFRVYTKINAKKMWGYDYFYLGNDLILKINKPQIVTTNNPLDGRIIAIDPGHGADELGAVGPTGIPEKTVNLRMSKYLKEELEKYGAKVIMTRTSDDINPDLFERPEIAQKNKAEILISVHNNALPDGKNPYKEHGTSVYYYHPQAHSLATQVQNELVKELKFKDLGVFWGSLVLTRPTDPVSILVEVGFMINPYEYEKIITSEYQKRTAVAIRKGIENYFKTAK